MASCRGACAWVSIADPPDHVRSRQNQAEVEDDAVSGADPVPDGRREERVLPRKSVEGDPPDVERRSRAEDGKARS